MLYTMHIFSVYKRKLESYKIRCAMQHSIFVCFTFLSSKYFIDWQDTHICETLEL
jgi:hypothetical protein